MICNYFDIEGDVARLMEQMGGTYVPPSYIGAVMYRGEVLILWDWPESKRVSLRMSIGSRGYFVWRRDLSSSVLDTTLTDANWLEELSTNTATYGPPKRFTGVGRGVLTVYRFIKEATHDLQLF